MSITSVIRYVFALDTTATDGSGKSGLAFGDITAKYLREGGTLTSLTTETITTLGTYQAPTSNAHIRIKELAGSNPTIGIYEVHFHNDQLADTTRKNWLFLSASNAKFQPLEIDLRPYYADLKEIGGDSQSATDAKDFFDTGYDPSTHLTADQAGVTTLLSRLSAARAGYLDWLNVGSNVATQADVDAINQSASRRILLTTVGLYERPESGGTYYTIECRTFTADGNPVNADSTPTLTATGQTSGDLSINLGIASNPATGVYRWTYFTTDTATIEPVRFDVSAAISATTFTLSVYSQIVDYVATHWNTTDATRLAAIYNKLPSKAYLTGTVNSDGDVEMSEATGNFPGTVAGIAGTLNTLDQLDAAQDTQHTTTQTLVNDVPTNAELATALAAADDAVLAAIAALNNLSSAQVTTALDSWGKTGFSLAANGIDLILVESGISAGAGLTNDTGAQLTSINARQALALMLSALAAKLAGAGTTNVTIKQAGKPAGNTRIDATVTTDGNRTSLTLKVPD